jgi:hypothetical protein
MLAFIISFDGFYMGSCEVKNSNYWVVAIFYKNNI